MITNTFLAQIRTQHDWTQEDMAHILGVSRPTYNSLEKGNISPTIEQLNKLADKIGCQPQDILSENIINEDKYREVLIETIRQGADTDGKITKTKLAKLIYLNDFGWYYYHLESMTGAKYRKLPLGPVPNSYFSSIDELFESGFLKIEIKNNDSQLISLSTAGERSKSKLLNQKEIDFIKKVSHKWRGVRAQEIVAFTHEQLPYKICRDGEVIPYELITQQDPDYVY
jgi:DNA-binding XRE family transcriptional regulator